MMQAIRFSLLVCVISNYVLLCTEAQGNAFDKNINPCLFDGWRSGKTPVLSKKVDCSGHERTGLCYGIKQPALFAVCYNKNTLIPEFSGHIVEPATKRASGRDAWRNEAGRYAPNPQSHFNDYDPFLQRNIVPHFDHARNLFYGRGHLTPNGDFAIAEDRDLTMVNTNIAPQWQPFNGENWATLEDAVRKYADQNRRRVFVFTGTGGTTFRLNNGQQVPMLLNQRVLVPKYFWKAVCDPKIKSSVVFVSENPTGTGDNQPTGGCDLTGVDRKKQTPYLGVIFCYSLDSLKSKNIAEDFKLPPFAPACKPSVRGTFLDNYLKGLK